MTDKTPGLYIHVPFCRSKCPYCDFYSMPVNTELKEKYIAATAGILSSLEQKFNTVYFGGGSPDMLGEENIAYLLGLVNRTEDAEITVECNPSGTGCEKRSFDFGVLSGAGVNRISLGLQSAVDTERRQLGRTAGIKEAGTAVKKIQEAGIDNISLDVMLGIPGQTEESLRTTLEYCVNSGAKHISAYMLKIEEGTYFHKVADKLNLPGEDEVCDMYLAASEFLRQNGFLHYEISNFALPGYESRHNLKYWHCEEYEGIGPSAHSFMHGKRYCYPRDISSYIEGKPPVYDSDGADPKEYIMLALRLSEGLVYDRFRQRFSKEVPDKMIEYALLLEKNGLARVTDKQFNLTPEGFLVSNTAILNLIGLL